MRIKSNVKIAWHRTHDLSWVCWLHTASPTPTRQALAARTLSKSTCLEHTDHSTIRGMDSEEEQPGVPAGGNQNSTVRRCWKQARGEIEWGHKRPEESVMQEEGGIEESFSGTGQRRGGIAVRS